MNPVSSLKTFLLSVVLGAVLWICFVFFYFLNNNLVVASFFAATIITVFAITQLQVNDIFKDSNDIIFKTIFFETKIHYQDFLIKDYSINQKGHVVSLELNGKTIIIKANRSNFTSLCDIIKMQPSISENEFSQRMKQAFPELR